MTLLRHVYNWPGSSNKPRRSSEDNAFSEVYIHLLFLQGIARMLGDRVFGDLKLYTWLLIFNIQMRTFLLNVRNTVANNDITLTPEINDRHVETIFSRENYFIMYRPSVIMDNNSSLVYAKARYRTGD